MLWALFVSVSIIWKIVETREWEDQEEKLFKKKKKEFCKENNFIKYHNGHCWTEIEIVPK